MSARPCEGCGSPALCAAADRCTRENPLHSTQPPGPTTAQLSDALAEVLDDYLDECATLDEVDSADLADQLAAVVMERRFPPGVQYISGEGLRQTWGH